MAVFLATTAELVMVEMAWPQTEIIYFLVIKNSIWWLDGLKGARWGKFHSV